MDSRAVLTTLGISYSHDGFDTEWAQSGAGFPAVAETFLDGLDLDSLARRVPIADEAIPGLIEGARIVRNSQALLRLFWHCHCALVDRGRHFALPPECAMMGERRGMLQVLLAVTAVPALLARHAAFAIAPDITNATLDDIALWMRDYHKKNGRWGLAQLGWLRNHILGDLFRLGRLQFMSARANTHILGCRNMHTGDLCTLAAPGAYRADGFFDGLNNVNDPAAWHAAQHINAVSVAGHPVTQDGRVAREPVTLPLSEWRIVLRDGDDVLDVHIPAEMPLDTNACITSFSEALGFFRELCPGRNHKAFVCCSWLLDSQLASLLPAESNIVRFQKLFRLHPSHLGEHQTYERVFGDYSADPETLPAVTRLQKACLQHIRAGGRFAEGNGFILVDDLRAAGASPGTS